MTRQILCSKCGVLKPMHREDVAMGLKRRRIILTVKKPADHAIIINGVKQAQMRSLACDGCGTPVADGEEAVAVTMWMPSREGTPGDWEREYQ